MASAGLDFKQSAISLLFAVGHSTIVARVFAFSAGFTACVQGANAEPLNAMPLWNVSARKNPVELTNLNNRK